MLTSVALANPSGPLCKQKKLGFPTSEHPPCEAPSLHAGICVNCASHGGMGQCWSWQGGIGSAGLRESLVPCVSTWSTGWCRPSTGPRTEAWDARNFPGPALPSTSILEPAYWTPPQWGPKTSCCDLCQPVPSEAWVNIGPSMKAQVIWDSPGPRLPCTDLHHPEARVVKGCQEYLSNRHMLSIVPNQAPAQCATMGDVFHPINQVPGFFLFSCHVLSLICQLIWLRTLCIWEQNYTCHLLSYLKNPLVLKGKSNLVVLLSQWMEDICYPLIKLHHSYDDLELVCRSL